MLLRRRAEEILSLSEKTIQEIGNKDHEVSGEISIGCGITEATQTMGELVKKFSDRYPKVHFNIRNGNSEFILENIDRGLIDLGFVLEPVELEKLNFIRLNKEERWGVLLHKDSPLSSKDFIMTDDLIDQPIINSARKENQTVFTKWMGEDADKLKIVATSDLTTTAAILVKNKIGCAIIVEGSAQDVMDDSLCFKPLNPSIITNSLMVWKKYQSQSFTISKFIDFVQEQVKLNK